MRQEWQPAPETSWSARIRVVLVEPENSLNIGSVARAMLNFGCSDLVVVAPRDYSEKKALATACWAEDLVRTLPIRETLPEALDDVTEVVGFSTRQSLSNANLLLHEWAGRARAQPPRRVALVFGPEDTGLRNEHLEHCRWLVRIPTSTRCPALNLAQAVLVAVYELSREEWAETPSTAREAPDWNQFYQLERLVDDCLTEVEFFRPGTPRHVPGMIKNLLKRTHPDEREMRVLLGLFGRIASRLRYKRRSLEEDPGSGGSRNT